MEPKVTVTIESDSHQETYEFGEDSDAVGLYLIRKCGRLVGEKSNPVSVESSINAR